MTMKQLRAGALALGMVGGMIGGTAQAGTVLTIGHAGAPDSLTEASASAFVQCANEGLGVAATVQPVAMDTEEDVLAMLANGEIILALTATIMPSVDATFGLFDLPHLITDRAHRKRVQMALGNSLQKAANRHGYRILGYVEAESVTAPAYVLVSNEHFSKLDLDMRATLEECADSLRDHAGQDEDAPPLADRDALIDAARPLYDDFAKRVEGGQALIDRALGLAKTR